MNRKNRIIVIGGLTGIVACIGDFLSLFIFGRMYPGYSQSRDLISLLGNTQSPVSGLVSLWWILLGILFMIYAFGLYTAYIDEGKPAKVATLLILLYGIGEGIGSGLFKADSINGSMTLSYQVHDLIGAIGIFAIIILPIVLQKMQVFSSIKGFKIYSNIVLISGLIFWIIFSFRFLRSNFNPFGDTMGLWQRMFLLDYYIYMIVVAWFMIGKSLSSKQRKIEFKN